MAGKPRSFGDTVLVVEDYVDLCDVLADVVRDSGRLAFIASDGADALRMLDSGMVPRPCLILLDWVMQGMSGDEFLAELAKRAVSEDVGVVVMSASLKVDVRRIPSVLGFLQKPFEMQELLSVLNRFC